ncbi:hypothetical protein [Streptomyces sp. NBC_00519]|uniref:hypothetical protein n=1 Tax=Streptomyces sp. NBC_00519 TaxID=2975764 RepID=UPI0030DE97C4
MRDLIACLVIWLRPGLSRTLCAARRHIRARLASTPPPPPLPVLPAVPRYARGPLPAHVIERRKPLDGHANRLVRPYLVAHEQALAAEQVRRLQRERRTATALATLGIDYDPALALSTSVARPLQPA